MHRSFITATAVLISVLLQSLVLGAGVTFYVAADGSDENCGIKDKPFATLTRAREAIRQLRASKRLPDGGIAVEILGGTYCLSESFQLGREDSGTASARRSGAASNTRKQLRQLRQLQGA